MHHQTYTLIRVFQGPTKLEAEFKKFRKSVFEHNQCCREYEICIFSLKTTTTMKVVLIYRPPGGKIGRFLNMLYNEILPITLENDT